MRTRTRQKPKPGSGTVLRAAIYIRVSSEELVQGYSLDAQDRAGQIYCDAQGWGIVERYRDEGFLPGLTMWRSARMIADAEAGLIDVVLLHKIDRFARSMLVALQTFKRLEAVGVSFVSISEKMDFSTPMWLAMLANILSVSER